MTTFDPAQQLARLVDEARRHGDPCTPYASFITVDGHGSPASRIVTIREVGAQGIRISVNAESPKIRQLQCNGKWECLFFWPVAMIQVRVRGDASLAQTDHTRAEWLARAPESRLVDVYHAQVRQQSSPVETRKQLLDEIAALKDSLAELPACPNGIGSLWLVPSYLEIWRGSLADRLHDRREYWHDGDRWNERVLVP